MSKGNGVTSEMPYMRPEERGRWEEIRLAIYNPSTHEVLGRTAKSWGGLAIFYTIFYIILAAFFAICMKGLMLTLDKDVPYFLQDSSLIGTSPGLGFRPGTGNPTAGGSIIWYESNNDTNVGIWMKRIDDFLEVYRANTPNSTNKNTKVVVCNWNSGPRSEKQVCDVNVDNMGPCNRANFYGYKNNSPCVFIKLNRIFGWEPEVYNDPNDLHPDMPEDLQKIIKSAPNQTRDTVWVSCHGELTADKEHVGPISFYPMQGFPAYYFPYKNQKGYQSPVVAIQFERPAVNILINVECRAWAKNINYRRHHLYREGSVHFELLIDVNRKLDESNTTSTVTPLKVSDAKSSPNSI